MKIENKYLSYEEYKELGGAIQEALYNLLEYRAEKKIDKYTFKRFRKIDNYPTELKMCVYDLIPLMTNDNNSNIVSESIGNYSVTKKTKKELEKDISEIINDYLSEVSINNIPVLYIGADED